MPGPNHNRKIGQLQYNFLEDSRGGIAGFSGSGGNGAWVHHNIIKDMSTYAFDGVNGNGSGVWDGDNVNLLFEDNHCVNSGLVELGDSNTPYFMTGSRNITFGNNNFENCRAEVRHSRDITFDSNTWNWTGSNPTAETILVENSTGVTIGDRFIRGSIGIVVADAVSTVVYTDSRFHALTTNAYPVEVNGVQDTSVFALTETEFQALLVSGVAGVIANSNNGDGSTEVDMEPILRLKTDTDGDFEFDAGDEFRVQQTDAAWTGWTDPF